MADIKAYRPQTNSLSSGQVLHCPYSYEKARLIVREMTDLLALELMEKGLVTDKLVLTVGYDRESLAVPGYTGPVVLDPYGRKIPRHAHGTANLRRQTASTRQIVEAVMELYGQIVDPKLLVRRINLTAAQVVREGDVCQSNGQLDLFSDAQAEEMALEREKRRQQAVIRIRGKYGKNAILKGMNFQEGATARERNRQIGGHRA